MYYAAGSPWYLTLFGRDSLWTARLALPLGWETALGTVRALARRQGRRVDPDTEEAPGKILHEVRPPDAATWLPPVYYGSVDATALFVSTIADAYRWGAPATDIAPLLANVERAMAWLTAHAEFVTYRSTGHGLANQAWKDSGDGVQYADGRIADRSPVAQRGPGVRLPGRSGRRVAGRVAQCVWCPRFRRGGRPLAGLGRGAPRAVPGPVLVH